MKRVVATSSLLGLALGLCLAAEAQEAASSATKPAMKKEAKLWPAADIKWVAAAEGGTHQAVITGDPRKGRHAVLDKFPAGASFPLHWHTHGLTGVVVSGTMVIGLEGEAAKELGPGSVVVLPGGVKHTTVCKAGADCVVYGQWSGMFDVQAAEAPKK